mmetsp:Transcript_8946/g.25991  ORF Transcript_8946/g.25991 Transcript_8946/m.25991 type:complete len:202 (-) Transcript_8946:63-668(-)
MRIGQEVRLDLIQRPIPVRDAVLELRWHFRIGLLKSFRLENRIPAKVLRPARRNNRARGTPHEHLRLGILSCAEAENALCISRLVRISRKKIVQALVTNAFKKPLDVYTGQSIQCVEAEGGIFNQHRPIHLLGSESALFTGNVLRRSLKFRQIYASRHHRDRITDDLLHLSQLLCVSSDKGHCLPYGRSVCACLLGRTWLS